jgi:hypothetical protein
MAPGDLKLLQHSSSFFARKFAPDSDIIHYLPMESPNIFTGAGAPDVTSMELGREADWIVASTIEE